MTNTDKVLHFLRSIAPQQQSNSEIVARTGIRPHQQVFQITQRLLKADRINRHSPDSFQIHGDHTPNAPPL